MSPLFEIVLIAVVVALSCSLLGVFLVLKKMAMMSDAITHTILLGIVIAFFITEDMNSPWLILGASLMGVLTVYLIEALQSTKLLSEESSIGVIFPLLFSIAIILISKYAGSVHIDTDAVLLGELSFAPFDRMLLFGISLPKSLVTMSVILVIDALFVFIFYKELKLSSFDPLLAATLGFSPVIIHYALMSLISMTAVGSFSAVGSILVIAFMIGPPLTAYLLTHDLKKLIFISSGFAIMNAVLGFLMAFGLNVSISGSMAVVTGLSFTLVYLFAPTNGLISTKILRTRQAKEFAQTTVLFHLFSHEHDDDVLIESGINTIDKHLNWPKTKIEQVIRELEDLGMLEVKDEQITLTKLGREASILAADQIFDR